MTGTYHTIIGQSGSDDDLVTINGGVDGSFLVLQADSDSVTITLKDGSGIKLAGAADFVMNNSEDIIMFIYSGALSAWIEISRSDNGA